MITPSPSLPGLLAEISTLLDSIEAALINQATGDVPLLCQRLQQALQNNNLSSSNELAASPEDQVQAQLISHRLSVLRKTLLQQSAANERALATLLPERVLGVYSNKSGFGSHVVRGTNAKSYQA